MRTTFEGQFGVWQHLPGAGGFREQDAGSCQFKHLKKEI